MSFFSITQKARTLIKKGFISATRILFLQSKAGPFPQRFSMGEVGIPKSLASPTNLPDKPRGFLIPGFQTIKLSFLKLFYPAAHSARIKILTLLAKRLASASLVTLKGTRSTGTEQKTALKTLKASILEKLTW